MSSIPIEVLTKLIVELLKYGIVAGVVWSYKQWWPKLRAAARGILPNSEKRLNRLNKLIARYENYLHTEELESQSKVYRNLINALKAAALTLLISTPLIIAVLLLFGEAIVVDVVVNLKPGTIVPKQTAVWFWASRIYGAVLGICVSAFFIFLDQAFDVRAGSVEGV